jgi:hypothetical protein
MDLDDFADISNILAEHEELEELMPFYSIGIQNARWNPINNAEVSLLYSLLQYSLTI